MYLFRRRRGSKTQRTVDVEKKRRIAFSYIDSIQNPTALSRITNSPQLLQTSRTLPPQYQTRPAASPYTIPHSSSLSSCASLSNCPANALLHTPFFLPRPFLRAQEISVCVFSEAYKHAPLASSLLPRIYHFCYDSDPIGLSVWSLPPCCGPLYRSRFDFRGSAGMRREG